eukprot:scaffold73256_cov39-Phaeocystis_antarctica.AAC.1
MLPSASASASTGQAAVSARRVRHAADIPDVSAAIAFWGSKMHVAGLQAWRLLISEYFIETGTAKV